jgi:hypothetical protein
MSYWSCELDMSSSLAPDLRSSHFYTTSFTDNSFVSDSLVFTTCTFIVFARPEDLLTEESTTFRSLCTIVYRLRDENFTIRECSNIISGSETNGNCCEVIE